MTSKTFIIGAGYSATGGFPLVRGLKERVIRFVETEGHPLYQALFQPGNGGFVRGQFHAGLDSIDPTGALGFEELLISLNKRIESANGFDPCFTTRNVLQNGCARLLWNIHNSIQKVPQCYTNFAGWLRRSGAAKPNAVVSFNWDVLAENVLAAARIPWAYSISNSNVVPILKPHGSINWTGYLREGLSCDYPGLKPLSTGSKLCFDTSSPLSNPDPHEANPGLRYMLFPGDSELPDHDNDLRLIWSEVERAILERDGLVFLGYSMPDYDSFAVEFFKQFGSKNIEVYNPSEEHLERFKTVFGSRAKLFRQTFEESPYGHLPAT